MNKIGQNERATQNRIVALLTEKSMQNCIHLGFWEEGENISIRQLKNK